MLAHPVDRPAHAPRRRARVVLAAALIPAALTVGVAHPAAAAGSCNGLAVTIQGTDGPDNLLGTSGPDVIDLQGGNDTLDAGTGNDTICVGTGTKTIFGGSQRPVALGDTIVYTGITDALTIDLAAGTASAIGLSHTLSGIENVVSGSGSDIITGNDARNRLNGAAGNDTIRPSGGDDTIIGGPGARDRIDFTDSPNQITADLAAGTATGDGNDTIQTIEDITGSAQRSDRLSGSDLANRIDGGGMGIGDPTQVIDGRGGDDILTGGDGPDAIFGGPGSDVLNGLGDRDRLQGGNDSTAADASPNTLNGGEGDDFLGSDLGDDTINGGPGEHDAVRYLTATGSVTVTLAAPASASGMGNDTLTGVEDAVGSSFADEITGNGLGNGLEGGNGDDTLRGLGGDDVLIGNGGADDLVGGPGTDVCTGGGPVISDSDPDTATTCEALIAIP